jgi:hypothetical protein
MYTRDLYRALPFLTSTHALKLLVSSYGTSYGLPGSLQTLSLSNGSNNLQVTSTSQDCGSLASWLELSPDKSTVLCVDEFVPGSLTLLSIKKDGKLQMLSNASTPGGPVSSVFFGSEKKRAVALAHVSTTQS